MYGPNQTIFARDGARKTLIPDYCEDFMPCDWMWCYENPEQAAQQIDLLRATLDADRDGTKKLAAERDKWFDKTQSDAKVITEKDAEIGRLNSAFDDCAENANASQAEVERQEKVIADLRARERAIIDRTWGYAFEDDSVPSTAIQDKIIAAVNEQLNPPSE